MSLTPLRTIGDTVVLADVPEHIERLALGARAPDARGAGHDDDGPPEPVIVRHGQAGWNGLDADSRAYFGPEAGYLEDRLRLRVLLAGPHVARVLGGLVNDSGALVGTVEEHVGDVTLAGLEQAMRQQPGAYIPVHIALAIFRGACAPMATLERILPGQRVGFEPADVFVGHDGVVRSLIDPYPGWNEMARGTAVGVIRGNYSYMAPEVIAGRRTDGRAPLFSAGVVLFELLAGQHPFEEARGQSPIAMLQALYQRPLPSLASLRKDLPAPVLQLVERLCRRDPAERYVDWSSVVAAIDEAAGRLDPAPPSTVAAFAHALVPEAMQRAVDRREQIALLDLAALQASLPSTPGVRAAPPPPPSYFARPGDRAPAVVGPVDAERDAEWDVRTPPAVDAPFMGTDGCAMWMANIDGDEVLVDASPVSNTAWARFCLQTGHPPPPSWGDNIPPVDIAELPVTGIGPDEAARYAAHFGKRLPDNALWESLVRALGPARLGVGAVWEWTSTPSGPGDRGFVVRGGRYRDTPGIPSAGFTGAWDDRAADDIGFRCASESS